MQSSPLLGEKAGKIEADGKFTEGSVHSKVYSKLKEYYIKSFDDPTEEEEEKKEE